MRYVVLCFFVYVGFALVHGIGLGTYVGNPDGSDPGAMQSFENNFDNFTRAMGATPQYMNTFVDYSRDWDTWIANAQWTAWSWTKSNRSANLIPVVGLPMIPSSYYNNEDQGLDEVISGQQDDTFIGIAKAFLAENFTTVHFRIGWEPDGNWYSWNFNGKNSSGDSILPQWLAAWRHIAKLVKSIPGLTAYTTWNPCVMQWTAFNVSDGYPGDDVVDVIALDIYSPVYPGELWDWQYNNGTMAPNVSVWSQSSVNREHYWNLPAATQWVPDSLGGWGMVAHLQLAQAHNKPIAICECGVGLSPSYPDNGIADDGDFPVYLAKQLSASGLTTLYIDIWDVNVGDGLWCFSDGSKPLAAAAWKASFGN